MNESNLGTCFGFFALKEDNGHACFGPGAGNWSLRQTQVLFLDDRICYVRSSTRDIGMLLAQTLRPFTMNLQWIVVKNMTNELRRYDQCP